MVNYLEMGAKVLQERMETYAGVNLTYRRVNGQYPNFSFSIVGIPGRNPVDIVDQNGVVLRSQIQDFNVNIGEMRGRMLDPKRPMRGDEIIMTFPGGYKVVFIVTGEDFSTSHYEPADSYGVAWRIHTRSDRIL